MYIPSHVEKLLLIPIIQIAITNQINNHPNHTYIMCRDFNKDISLIGRQSGQQTTPPRTKDYQWQTFIDSLELEYITTNTRFCKTLWP